MSQIDELIAEYCPNGVNYFSIEEIFDLRNGYTPSKSNQLFWEGGSIPWFRMEDIRENGGILSESLQQITAVAVKGGRLFPANSLIVATSATIGEHALITVPHLSNQRFTSLSPKPEFLEKLDMKFAYYYGFMLDDWCRNNTTTSSFSSVDMRGFKKFKFPVPPLEVQRAVVNILDKFTALEAELEAELEARKKQYEHYRSQILSADKSARWMTLEEVCHSISAGGDRPGDTVKGQKFPTKEHPYPVYSNGSEEKALYGFTDSYKISDESVTISARGTIGYHAVRSPKFTPIIRLLVLIPNTELISAEFLNYILDITPISHSGGSIPQLTVPALKLIKIPLPELQSQHKIVDALEKFDALVNNLSSGLPAEITARRKQYEYYRDQLLTFKELAS